MAPKMVHPHNSGSAVRSLEFCTMKGANSQMKIILLIFSKKKFCLGQMDHFGPKKWMAHPHNSRYLSKIFLKILHNKKGQQVDESNNNGLYQKSFVQDKWAILGPKMAHLHNSGSIIRIFLKFCRMKGANRYMKILLVVF